MLSSLTRKPHQSLLQVLNFALVLSTAFMLWKSLSVLANSPSPIVVVLSGSMEPAFQRGDLLFLWNRDRGAAVGEIVVYNVKGKDIPIVHRVVRSFEVADGQGDVVAVAMEDGDSTPTTSGGGSGGRDGDDNGGDEGEKDAAVDKLASKKDTHQSPPSVLLLTKGDNNVADDTELYARDQSYLNRQADIIGSVRAYVPMVGYVTIMLSEHPWLKTVMLGTMGVMVMLQRE